VTNSTPEVVSPSIANALVTFSTTKVELIAMAAECRGLKIAGVEDRAGLALVHDARMRLKNTRVAIEKTRKDLKADALEYGRKVDQAAKELTAEIEPTERELEAEETRIDTERARIKAEVEAVRRAKLDERVLRFAGYGVQVAPSAVEALTDAECEAQLDIAKAEYGGRIERERLAAEQKVRDEAAQAEIIAAQKAELARQAAEQREAQSKLDAERRAFEEQQSKARQVQAEADAKARGRADAERERAQREAEVARLEALRPVALRIEAFAEIVRTLGVPEVPCTVRIRRVLERAANEIDGLAWEGSQS